MNILVIGNGFDLAHDLPTKYTDFLEWVKKYQQFYSYATRKRTAEYKETNEPILRYFNNLFYVDENKAMCNEIYKLLYDNIWIDYFLHNPMYQKENWIDFENEISKVIQSLDNDMHGQLFNCNNHGGHTNNIDDIVYGLSNEFLRKEYSKNIAAVEPFYPDISKGISFRTIRDRLFGDLNKLIRAFEIYLTEYVEEIEIKKKSPDIEELKIDHVLSFNYTHTFSKLYKRERIEKSDSVIFDYIHGEANIDHFIESNNMVLGIDEYLSDERKNKDIDFIAFKKYYQRIHKQTGCKYKNWVDRIRQDYFEHIQKLEDAEYMKQRYIPDSTQRMFNKLTISALKDEKCPKHNLYIFGHSLDVTDKDVLKDLILNDNVSATIFYHNKDAMGQQIANLVKVIGQDELIRRTGGSTKTIEFKLQKRMIPIENI